MTVTIELEDRSAQALQTLHEQAAARRLPLDRYLRTLADNSERVLGPITRSPHDLSASEFQQWLKDLSAGMPEIPALPADLSRADLYNDHD